MENKATGQRPVRNHIFRRLLWSAWPIRMASWNWPTVAWLVGGVLLLWEARLGPPFWAWPFRLAGLLALAATVRRAPAHSAAEEAFQRSRRVWQLQIGPEGIQGWIGAKERVYIPWEQLREVREHAGDVFEVVGQDTSFFFDTALSGWPDALGLLHRFLRPPNPDQQVASWTLTPAQLEDWLGPLARQTPIRFQRRMAAAEWIQFGLPMAGMGLLAVLASLGQSGPGWGFSLVATASAILLCGGLLTLLRWGQGVDVEREGLTLRQNAGESRLEWAEVVGVAGRSAMGTLRVQTRRGVHLLGCVAQTPALVRLLNQVVRLNAYNPKRLTELDVPQGALSRFERMAPEPSDAALTQVVRRGG